ncbi:MAG TPA: helix-turn-helix transcriptional regulator [Bellilinea sp.]|nr:helix-turn-helix transcriptional regulator [Bellilinea sp.]
MTKIIFIPDEFNHLTFDTRMTVDAVLAAVSAGTWRPPEMPYNPPLNLGGLPLQAYLVGERAVLIFHPLVMEPRYLEIAAEMPLSERQVEVLHLLARGYTIKETANLLEISVRSVYAQLAGIRKKLQATSNMQALKLAAELGIVSGRKV